MIKNYGRKGNNIMEGSVPKQQLIHKKSIRLILLLFILIVLLGLIVSGIASNTLFCVLMIFNPGSNDVVKSIDSPDGKYTAIAFVWNGGGNN